MSFIDLNRDASIRLMTGRYKSNGLDLIVLMVPVQRDFNLDCVVILKFLKIFQNCLFTLAIFKSCCALCEFFHLRPGILHVCKNVWGPLTVFMGETDDAFNFSAVVSSVYGGAL
ncbi:hypothetical protein K7X08_030501 [Anisodus acutangulus]|uniref:Uncharacterized protein n=1 Tax=Anisodus acutangulus TaxID=402998 RepID=A0A9Q1L4M2_9SOLA|nr:hypothetical protein K7X08_030501 [Anisodus acutangulus]